MSRPASWRIVDVSRHERMYWRKPDDFAFARPLHVVPLGYEELSQAIAWLPVALERTRTGMRPVVVMRESEKSSSPLISESGTWRGGYIPAALRSFPFSMAYSKKRKLILTVLEDGIHVSENPSQGARMFDPLGKMGPELRQMTRFISILGADLQKSAGVARELADADCLTPFNKTNDEGASKTPRLYTLNAQKLLDRRPSLERLGGEAQLLGHALYFSVPRLKTLQRLSQNSEQGRKVQRVTDRAADSDFVGAFFSAMDTAENLNSDPEPGSLVKQEQARETLYRADS